MQSHTAQESICILNSWRVNNHHLIEAMFKAFSKALDEAVQMDPRIVDVLSTKGSLVEIKEVRRGRWNKN